MNSVNDKNFYKNIYLRKWSQVIHLSMKRILSLIKYFCKNIYLRN